MRRPSPDRHPPAPDRPAPRTAPHLHSTPSTAPAHLPGTHVPVAAAHAYMGNAAIARSLTRDEHEDVEHAPLATPPHAPPIASPTAAPPHEERTLETAPPAEKPPGEGAVSLGGEEPDAGDEEEKGEAANVKGAKAPPKEAPRKKGAAEGGGAPAKEAEEKAAPEERKPSGPIAPEAVVDSLDVPASQGVDAILAAREGAKAGFENTRKDMAANPPSIERPSGLPRKEKPVAPPGDAGVPPRAKGSIDKATGEPPKPGTGHVAALGPLPEIPKEVEHRIEAAPENKELPPAAVEHAIDSVPAKDDAVNTDPGPPPTVPLEKDADPANMQADVAAHQPAIDQQWKDARDEAGKDYGENDVYPVVPREKLRGKAGTGTGSIQPGKLKPVALPAEARPAMDAAAGGQWSAAVADAKSKDAEKKADKAKGDEDARSKADSDIKSLETEATKEQLAARAKGKEEVAAAKKGWTGDLEAADKAYGDKKTRLIKDTTREIDNEKKKADKDAQKQYADTKREAEAKKKEAEADAEKEKTKKKSGGVIGWLKRKVKAAITAIKNAIHAIFDKLRQWVKKAIQKLKEAVLWVIDQARKAIVRALHAFEGLLDLAVDVFLDAFPAAKTKAKEWIHKGIAAAEAGVNKAADWLKKGVEKVLDALGKALDWVLSLYEKAINLILDVIEFIAVGILEIIEGIVRLARSAAKVGDHFLGQMEEELIGMNFEEPLPIEKKSEPTPKAAAGAAIEAGRLSPADAKLFSGGLGDGDVSVDKVAKLDLSPELIRSLALQEGKDLYFDGDAGPGGTVDALRASAMGVPLPTDGGKPVAGATPVAATAGTAAGEGANVAAMTPDQQLEYLDKQPIPETCEAKKTEEPAKGDAEVPDSLRVYGAFTRGQRAKYMWSQIKKGVSQWWHCNWKKVVAIFAVAALIALLLGILTGGAIFAAIPPLLELIGTLLIGVAVVRAGLWIKDYLSAAWGGDLIGGAKALARAFAILVIELVFALLFNIQDVIKAAKGGLKGIEEGVAKAAKTTVRETIEAASKLKGAFKASWKAGVENGRFIIKGFEEGIGQGIKNIGELTLKFLKKFPFRGFFFRLKKRTLELWGIINPKILLGEMTLSKEEVEEGLAAAKAAGKPIGNEARTAAKKLAEDLGEFALTAKSGASLPRRIANDLKQLLRDIREQLLGENKIMQKLWETAAKEVAEGKSEFAKFLDAAGKIKAGTSAEKAAETYAAVQKTLSKRFPEYMEELEKTYGPLANRISGLPERVQLHHLLPKSLFPELATEAKNLVMALRKAGREAPDELHDLLHWIGAGALKAGGRTRWTTYRLEAMDLIRKWLGI